MELKTPALVCAARPHGETAVIARLLTPGHGMLAAYVAGGRGRVLRPVLVPGNLVAADIRSRDERRLPFAALELLASRGQWLTEPLPAAAMAWATALTASALPERHPYPALFEALSALLDAICHAPSARGWVPAMIAYESLLLRELGYGEGGVARLQAADTGDWPGILAQFDQLGRLLSRYVLAERRGDVLAARDLLRERLGRIEG